MRMGCGRPLPKRTDATPGDQRSVPVDGPSVPGPLWRGGNGASTRDRILDQLVAFGGGTPMPEVKGRDEMVTARGIHGGIGGDNGCRRCRNSSVSMVKSQ